MSHGRRKRIAPQGSCVTVEIRPGRHLRIQHFNPQPRDAKFEKEMQMFHQYRHQGFPSSGPLTMPKRSVKQPIQHTTTACENGSRDLDSLCQNVIGESLISPTSGKQKIFSQDVVDCPGISSQTSSLFSSPTHMKVNDNVRSASSVQVALHVKQKEEQSLFTKVQMNLPTDISEKDDNDFEESLKLDLTESNSKMENKNDTCDLNKSLPSPLNPPSEQTKANDAIFSFPPSKSVNMIDENMQGQCANKENMHGAGFVKDCAIFFVHGVGGSSDIWCAQTSYFSALGYEVIAPDLIGHGFSCTPKQSKAYHFKEIASDLEEVFDRYCKRRNVLVGHSYGASFVTMIARNRPRRVSKLILVSGGPPTPLAPQPGVFSLPTCMLGCIQPCLKCGFYKGAFHEKRTPIIPKEKAFNIPTYVLQKTMNGQVWADGDELYHNWLTCPCLLVYGDHDQLVSLQEEEHMAEAIYGSKLEVVKEASHMVMIEAPDEVNALIHEFINESPSGDAAAPHPNTNNSNEPSTQRTAETRQHLTSQRSRSRMSQRSLKSAKTQRSLPQSLFSKNFKKKSH